MKAKQLPMDELKECYVIDGHAPSGLSRIGSPGRKKGKIGPTGGIGSDGYWRVTHRGKIYRVHRIIWALHYMEDPGDFLVDHKDGNPLNNSLHNLRLCTIAQNLQNKKSPGRRVQLELPKNVLPMGRGYKVTIMTEGRLIVVRCSDLQEAALRASELRSQYHGDFARNE